MGQWVYILSRRHLFSSTILLFHPMIWIIELLYCVNVIMSNLSDDLWTVEERFACHFRQLSPNGEKLIVMDMLPPRRRRYPMYELPCHP